MANSLLQAFVSGARAMLSAQLVVSVGAVALAGWTLGVTNELIRERDRLQERVIQLEETMAARGDIPPAPAAVVQPAGPQNSDIVYPGSIARAVAATSLADATGATSPADQTTAEQSDTAAEQRNIGRIVSSLFGPAPPLRTVVLHVRTQADAQHASDIARTLQSGADIRVLIDVMPPGDQRQSGYAYFDGRQSRPAADVVTRLHDSARTMEVAQWSVQLRGTALPAQGEYTADRLDIVLPPLPEPAPPPAPVAIDPAAGISTPG